MDWNSAVTLAEFQTVSGLLFRGKAKLGSLNQIEWDGMMDCIGQLLINNTMLNDALFVIVKELDEKGIPYCLLKGQGIGYYYDEPEFRFGGDIDLYVGKYQRNAIEVLLPLTDDKEVSISGKHANLKVKGIEIELHQYVDSMIKNSMNNSFWKWSEAELFGKAKAIMIGGTYVKIPNPTFSVFSTFYHIFRHFLISGVGLRQLSDWGRVLYSERENIDKEILFSRLNEFGQIDCWDSFMTVLSEYLYLPECAQIYYEGKKSNANKVICHILQEGNFGAGIDNGIRPHGRMAVKWYNMKRIIRRSISTFTLFPSIVCIRFINYLFAGKNLVYNKSRKIDF